MELSFPYHASKCIRHICNRNTRLFLKCIYFSRYQINARTELARKYKNVSPLENHHAAMAFEILSRPECNIFSGMTSKETEAVHNVIYFNTFSSTYTLHIVCSSSNARSTQDKCCKMCVFLVYFILYMWGFFFKSTDSCFFKSFIPNHWEIFLKERKARSSENLSNYSFIPFCGLS